MLMFAPSSANRDRVAFSFNNLSDAQIEDILRDVSDDNLLRLFVVVNNERLRRSGLNPSVDSKTFAEESDTSLRTRAFRSRSKSYDYLGSNSPKASNNSDGYEDNVMDLIRRSSVVSNATNSTGNTTKDEVDSNEGRGIDPHPMIESANSDIESLLHASDLVSHPVSEARLSDSFQVEESFSDEIVEDSEITLICNGRITPISLIGRSDSRSNSASRLRRSGACPPTEKMFTLSPHPLVLMDSVGQFGVDSCEGVDILEDDILSSGLGKSPPKHIILGNSIGINVGVHNSTAGNNLSSSHPSRDNWANNLRKVCGRKLESCPQFITDDIQSSVGYFSNVISPLSSNSDDFPNSEEKGIENTPNYFPEPPTYLSSPQSTLSSHSSSSDVNRAWLQRNPGTSAFDDYSSVGSQNSVPSKNEKAAKPVSLNGTSSRGSNVSSSNSSSRKHIIKSR